MSNFGNYRGYQGPERHQGSAPASSHVPDVRLELLSNLIPKLFPGKSVLDVGCNAGKVTTDLGLHFHVSRALGVDIDPNLIKKALQHWRFCCSRTRPNEANRAKELFYFPTSALQQHGLRDISLGSSAEEPSWAERFTVDFRHEDWATSSSLDTGGPFDIILAFSVVKWIHLEHADAGLKAFFAKSAQCVVPGGYLILEVQPWKSYENAVKANKAPQFQAQFDGLQIRPEAFDELLLNVGFKLVSSTSQLLRELKIYQKITS